MPGGPLTGPSTPSPSELRREPSATISVSPESVPGIADESDASVSPSPSRLTGQNRAIPRVDRALSGLDVGSIGLRLPSLRLRHPLF